MSLNSSTLPLNKPRPSSLRKYSIANKIPMLPSISLDKTVSFSYEPQYELPLPTLTAKSWCISNASNGDSIWGKALNERLEMASLTKMMTAYLVCNLSERFQINLQNTSMIITKPMVMIGGTIGEIKIGDQISLLDLLYGLMLPSGNDCALALAGYFGGLLIEKFLRTKKHVELKFEQMVKRFLREMNIQAMKLALKSTTFANVHGLSHKGNKSTADELCKMAYHLLKNPIVESIVNTKSYSFTIFNVVNNTERLHSWKNTNKLLWRDGFCGIKTGTTPNAGACLIVLFKKDDVEIIITLLACNTTVHRWEEAKLLADWGYRNYLIKGIKSRRKLLKSSNSQHHEKIIY